MLAYPYLRVEQPKIDFARVVCCFIVSCDQTRSLSQRIRCLFSLSASGFHQWTASCLSKAGFALFIHPYSFPTRPSRGSLLCFGGCSPSLPVFCYRWSTLVLYHRWHCLSTPDLFRNLRFFCSASSADLAVHVRTQTSLSSVASICSRRHARGYWGLHSLPTSYQGNVRSRLTLPSIWVSSYCCSGSRCFYVGSVCWKFRAVTDKIIFSFPLTSFWYLTTRSMNRSLDGTSFSRWWCSFLLRLISVPLFRPWALEICD